MAQKWKLDNYDDDYEITQYCFKMCTCDGRFLFFFNFMTGILLCATFIFQNTATASISAAANSHRHEFGDTSQFSESQEQKEQVLLDITNNDIRESKCKLNFLFYKEHFLFQSNVQ